MRVMLITPDLSENSVGRTYCLHLLCEHLGWSNETWSLRGRGALWKPLVDTPFAATCRVPDGAPDDALEELAQQAADVDLLIAIKPRVDSLGVAWELSSRTGVPLLLDIDDPDIAVQQAYGTPLKRIGKRIFRRSVIVDATHMERLMRGLSCTVSNPTLQERHGGEVVTHVRLMPEQNFACRSGGKVNVVFTGSIQSNKGLPILRQAIAELAPSGYELTVTAPRPADAEVHEHWVGLTSLRDGMALSAAADIVVIPSLDRTWSRGQLPVKLVDALLAGTPTIVTSVPPLPWAIGPHGMVVPPGDVGALVRAMRVLGEPSVRESYGNALREHALSMMTIDVNARAFSSAVAKARPAPAVS